MLLFIKTLDHHKKYCILHTYFKRWVYRIICELLLNFFNIELSLRGLCFILVVFKTLDQQQVFTEDDLKEFESHISQQEDELNKQALELQKRKEELQRQHDHLQAQRQELQQVPSE